MTTLSFNARYAPIPSDEYEKLSEKLKPEIERVAAEWGAGFDADYASLSVPFDTEILKRVQELAIQKKKLKPKMMILIGIGGSNLGTLAVQQALIISENSQDGSLPLYCADTCDPQYIGRLYRLAKAHLERGEKILLVIVSKSGTTTETIANGNLFISLLEEHAQQSAAEQTVFITDEGSKLHQFAEKKGAACLTIPPKVGGRYSLFTAVGLFPLQMLDVDTDSLLAGARAAKEACTARDILKNPAAMSAITLFYYYQKGMHIHDLFLFVMKLRELGGWYRQLLAESIGKAENKQGKSVHVGITPTISIGSIDLHSVAQLYLAGPNERVTTFVRVQKESELLPQSNPLSELVPMIEGKSFSEIMHAIYDGTKKAYEHQKRPFMELEFSEISASSIGQFMQIKMVEIIYLGYLFDINPFDQPQVELYKKETRKILAHE